MSIFIGGNMKRFYIIPLLVIILVSLILAGCGSPSPSTTAQPATQAPTTSKPVTTPATSAAPSTSAAPTASAPATGKVIELRFAHRQ